MMEGNSLPMVLADRLLRDLEAGGMGAGTKLPSIRETVRLSGMSQGTVLEAYRILEDSGRIRAVRGSGYFLVEGDPEGHESPRSGRSRTISRVRLDPATDLAINLENRRLVAPFGLALPDESLLPLAALKRIFGKVQRLENSYSYSLPPGLDSLRRELGSRYGRMGGSVREEDVILTGGATESAFAVLSSLTRPGDLVAMESPIYGGFLHLAKLLELRILEVPVESDAGMKTEELQKALTGGAKIRVVITIPAYQNPTGALLSQERRRHLLELSSKYGFYILEDDIYGALHHGPHREATLRSMDRSRVFLISSLSKVVSPAYRVGWILAPEEWKEAIMKRIRITTLGNSRMVEESLSLFMSGGGLDRHMRKFRSEIRRRVHYIRNLVLREFPDGTRVSLPSGGFLIWVELPSGADSLEIQRQAFDRGITISPGVIYSPSGGYRNYFRLNCAVAMGAATERAIRVLGELVRE